jgi:multiple sugar transport system substrate-binding protein
MKKMVLAALAVLGLAASMGLAQRTKVVWFVGLGTGSSADQIPIEKAVVERYNKSQDKIELVMEVVDNAQAQATLATRLAAGNPPDFVGPVGTTGYAAFKGQWADMAPFIAKYKPDLSDMDPALLKVYASGIGGTTREGIPYAVFPSFIYYNKDLFDEAGIPYPPTKFGELYQGKPWDWNALRGIAMKLTLDDAGKDATEAGFNPKKVVQFGFVNQWNTDPRAMGTTFGAASIDDEKGNVAIPPNWIAAWKWNQDAIWKDRFMPSREEMDQEVFGKGNNFNSGKFAMGYTHLWYQCCLEGGANAKVKKWGVAVIPSYNGKYTAKLHADTFRILKASKNQDAAFQAMWWLQQQVDLFKTYGAFPAAAKLQDDYIAAVNKKYALNAQINWQTIKDSLKYADIPNHEEWMPNFIKSNDVIRKLETQLLADPNFDLTKGVAALKTELQTTFNQAR